MFGILFVAVPRRTEIKMRSDIGACRQLIAFADIDWVVILSKNEKKKHTFLKSKATAKDMMAIGGRVQRNYYLIKLKTCVNSYGEPPPVVCQNWYTNIPLSLISSSAFTTTAISAFGRAALSSCNSSFCITGGLCALSLCNLSQYLCF